MLTFQMYERVKLLYGVGSVSQIGELVAEGAGLKKALIVCDQGVIDAGIVKKVTDSLEGAKVEYVLFDKVSVDPPIDLAEQGGALANAEGCDCVIAVGGGSCMDTGKAVNMLRFNEPPLSRYLNPENEMKLSPGLICIPTTSGTGSEVSDGMVLSDENHVKYPILATNAMSDYAVIDPELMVGMPPGLTAATGLDTLCHFVEGFQSNAANTLTDFFNKKGIEIVLEYLPRAVADGSDIEARSQMAVATCVGGWMLGTSHTNAGHSFGHTVGGHYNIPHGVACAAGEPYVIEGNAEVIPEKTKELAEMFGATFTGSETPAEIGAIARDAFIDFRDNKANMRPITSYNYDAADFEKVAEMMEVELFQIFNQKKLSKADCLTMIEKAFK